MPAWAETAPTSEPAVSAAVDAVLGRWIAHGFAISIALVRVCSTMNTHPITLGQGTYRLRRQRQLEPTDTGFYEQYGVLED